MSEQEMLQHALPAHHTKREDVPRRNHNGQYGGKDTKQWCYICPLCGAPAWMLKIIPDTPANWYQGARTICLTCFTNISCVPIFAARQLVSWWGPCEGDCPDHLVSAWRNDVIMQTTFLPTGPVPIDARSEGKKLRQGKADLPCPASAPIMGRGSKRLIGRAWTSYAVVAWADLTALWYPFMRQGGQGATAAEMRVLGSTFWATHPLPVPDLR